MAYYTAVASSSGQKVSRFIFSIQRDLHLLEVAIIVNPFHLGRAKWEDVVADLQVRHGYKLSSRTARERVEALVRKYKTGELRSRKATEEQNAMRENLLQEIITICGKEDVSVKLEAETDDTPPILELEESHHINPFSKRQRIIEPSYSDEEDDTVFERAYVQDEKLPRKIKKKTKEMDFLDMKVQFEMEMEQKRFELDKEMRHKQILLDEKKLEIELMRETRLAEESLQRQSILTEMQKTVNLMLELLKQKNSK